MFHRESGDRMSNKNSVGFWLAVVVVISIIVGYGIHWLSP
jgi:hypothetical protein